MIKGRPVRPENQPAYDQAETQLESEKADTLKDLSYQPEVLDVIGASKVLSRKFTAAARKLRIEPATHTDYWEQAASCKPLYSEMFLPSAGYERGHMSPYAKKTVKKLAAIVCSFCAVSEQCHEAAQVEAEPLGMRAGLFYNDDGTVEDDFLTPGDEEAA